MAIDSTTGATRSGTTNSAASAATAAQSQLGVDYNSFLKLLTAQISNQDPLQPMDSTQFVSQLAQLSQVEQSVQTNTNLESLNGKLDSVAAMSGVALMGRKVTVASDQMDLSGGAAQATYQLAGTASSVEAQISDASGTVVRTLTGLPTAGVVDTPVSWDGRSNSGQQLPDGHYSIAIKATDPAGGTLFYNTFATATVQQLLFKNGDQLLQLSNGQQVLSSQLVSVN